MLLTEEERLTLQPLLQALLLGVPIGECTRRALRSLVAELREAGLGTEQLLTALRRAWRELPEARQLPASEQAAAFARAIVVCVER
jgi:hypothetical protein